MITFELMGIYSKFVLANTEKFAVFSDKNQEEGEMLNSV